MEENLRNEEVVVGENKINGKTILLIGGAIGALALGAFALLKKKSVSEDFDDFDDEFEDVEDGSLDSTTEE